jgi:hypothetical protein
MAENPHEHLSEADLVAKSKQAPLDAPQYSVEMMRRLKNALVEQQDSTNVLTERIRVLTERLFWFTVVMAGLAVIQVILTIVQLAK